MSLTKKQAAKFNELRALGFESCNLPPEGIYLDPKNSSIAVSLSIK